MEDLTKLATKEEKFAYLKANKDLLIAEKKSAIKHADAVSYSGALNIVAKDSTNKAAPEAELPSMDSIEVVSVINTTNILDSHSDVHLPGIWNKSLKEQRQHYLVKEHQLNFDNVISDEVVARVEMKRWRDLGLKWEGETQALIFTSVINRTNKTGMLELYSQNKVKNHSIGMKYVKLYLAINSEFSDYAEEKLIWDKYIDEIINKTEAEEQGYFWAVTEAKIIEGSAVLRGSNIATPTISVSEPPDGTRKDEPPDGTQKDEPLKALRKNIFTKIAENIN